MSQFFLLKNGINKNFFYQHHLVYNHNLYRSGNKEVNVVAGVGYDMFKFKDTQRDMQNFMYSETKPVYKLGIELKF